MIYSCIDQLNQYVVVSVSWTQLIDEDETRKRVYAQDSWSGSMYYEFHSHIQNRVLAMLDHFKHINTHVIIKIFKGTLHISMTSVYFIFSIFILFIVYLQLCCFLKSQGILSENPSSLYNAVLLLDLFHLCTSFTRK